MIREVYYATTLNWVKQVRKLLLKGSYENCTGLKYNFGFGDRPTL